MRMIVVFALSLSQYAWCALHMDLDVELAPDARKLSVTALINTEIETLAFYLADNFVLEAASVDGATVPTNHTIVDGLQRFQIDLRPGMGAQTVSLRYHGTLQRLDASIAHHETLVALPAMASKKGSYLPGSSGWHPMFDSEFTYRVSIKVPEGQIAVAPGQASDESTSNGARHAVFSMTHPVDNIDLMVGPWKIQERDVTVGTSRIRLRTYFYADADTLSESYLDAAHRFIDRYSKSIGAYPFSEFSIVASPIPTGFGMPTLTYLGKDVLRFPFIRDISLGHEILHNWWGNGVRIDAARGNWAEGLTTFMADYAYKEDDGPDAAMRMRHGWLRNYATLPINSEQPLSEFRARHRAASAAIGYGKAAMMFYALRTKLGENTFRDGIQLFWKKHRFTAASFDDLRIAFEDSTEQVLTHFFDQWLERTGAPELRVVSARSSGEDNQKSLEIRISQDKQPYTLSLPVYVHVKNRSLDFRADISQSAQTFRLNTQAVATAVQIDPRFEVWRKLAPGEAPPILRDLISARALGVVSINRRLDEAALALAQEIGEGTPTMIKASDTIDSAMPVLVVGSKSECAIFLKHTSLSARSGDISDGSVEVWIVPETSRKIVVVALDPDAELNQNYSQLGRRLRHFGRYSWVSIAKDRAVTNGNWPILPPKVMVPK